MINTKGLLEFSSLDSDKEYIMSIVQEELGIKKRTPISKVRDLCKKSAFSIPPKWKIDLVLANELLNKRIY